MKKTTLIDTKKYIASALAGFGIEEAEVEATQLLEDNSGLRRHQFPFNGQEKADIIAIKKILERRRVREPLAYINGKRCFYGLDLAVTEDVLIPRPETELLAQAVLEHITGIESPRILDIGTGSGAIAIAIAANNSRVKVLASDILPEALTIARRNASDHKLADRIYFAASDLTESFRPLRRFDVIVSNPPYICSGDIDLLEKEISYEPRAALDGGIDGLEFFKRIVSRSASLAKEGCRLFMEIGCGQAGAVKAIIDKSPDWQHICTLSDYAGIERIVVCSLR